MLDEIEKIVDLYWNHNYSQEEVGKVLGLSQKQVWRRMKNNKIPTRVARKRNQWGENNDSWKGDKAGYSALHYRVYSKLGKAKKCIWCQSTEHVQWHNPTKEYTDVEKYISLCASCHAKVENRARNFK